jgi:glycosyltransferase involved in cell wall biosynthesis
MKLPRVSIVTPSFNQAAYLEQTIRSVLAQDYTGEIEYIVMDGGSTDGSVEIIQRFDDELASWTCERDEGQASAINRGFARASGTIFAWVNSDDLLAPSAVTVAIDAFTRLGEQVGVVYGDRLHIDARGNVIGINRMPAFYDAMFRRNFTLPQETVFFRREVFDVAGKLDEALRFSLDFDLWVRMARHTGVHHVPAFLGSFREHETSKSVHADRYLDEHASVYRKHFGRDLPSAMRMRVNRLIHKLRAALDRNSASYRAEVECIRQLTETAPSRKELVTH